MVLPVVKWPGQKSDNLCLISTLRIHGDIPPRPHTSSCNGAYLLFYTHILYGRPVTVAERSRICTVFARSEAGIVGSNPTQGMDV
jgi:hypothetical protein